MGLGLGPKDAENSSLSLSLSLSFSLSLLSPLLTAEQGVLVGPPKPLVGPCRLGAPASFSVFLFSSFF